MAPEPKTAVILFNLGGPDCAESVVPFLKNFFMDKNIVQAPWPVRFLVSRLIAWRRGRGAAKKAYGRLGGKSPLLDNTELQRTALERSLKKDYGGDMRCFIAMRYWHPLAEETARAVKAYDPDRIVLLPLYPQFSTTTTRSSFQSWARACRKIGLHKDTVKICCYPCHDGFIAASADLIRFEWQKQIPSEAPPHLREKKQIQGAPRADTFAKPKTRLLFSAHGLPEKIIQGEDPYQWQCEESARKIAAATGIENLDWQVCYQSRVGPLKWIGPSTEEALEQAARDGVGVMIYPHAFVSEHVETLVEIEEEYRHLAENLGIPFFCRVPTVSTHPKFIVGLKEMILQNLNKSGIVTGGASQKICPEEFSRCCQKEECR